MSKKRPFNTIPEPGSGPPGGGQIVLYQTEDGRQRIEVRLEGQTVWLTQASLAELFQTTTPNINIHLKRIYAEGELVEEATIKDYLIVRSEPPHDAGIFPHGSEQDAQYEKFAENRRIIEADHADEELRQQVRRLTDGHQKDAEA